MALYIPRSIFHLVRLLYIRPETFGPTHVNKRSFWDFTQQQNGSLLPTFQGRLLVPSSRVRAPENGPTDCLETSVGNNRTKLSKLPQERKSHRHRDGNLRSGKFILLCATGYGLDGPGIELLWGEGEIFPTRPDQPWVPKLSAVDCVLKCDGTRAETTFRLSAKRTSPFKSAGASVQSTAGSRGVRISGSNAGYTMLRGSVKSTGCPLHSPVSPSLPLPCFTMCHYISIGLYNGYRFIPGDKTAGS